MLSPNVSTFTTFRIVKQSDNNTNSLGRAALPKDAGLIELQHKKKSNILYGRLNDAVLRAGEGATHWEQLRLVSPTAF